MLLYELKYIITYLKRYSIKNTNYYKLLYSIPKSVNISGIYNSYYTIKKLININQIFDHDTIELTDDQKIIIDDYINEYPDIFHTVDKKKLQIISINDLRELINKILQSNFEYYQLLYILYYIPYSIDLFSNRIEYKQNYHTIKELYKNSDYNGKIVIESDMMLYINNILNKKK